MSSIERLAVTTASYLMSKRIAFRLAKFMLATQGVGWAGPGGGIRSSGEISFLKNSLEDLSKACVFDVGSNIGDYAFEVLNIKPDAYLHCFEPSLDHCKVLMPRFPQSKNVLINQFGLSNNNSKQTLYKDKKISGLASLVQRNLKHINVFLNKSEEVKTVIGDQYIKNQKIKRIDYLKIDVEGWEMNVLIGLKESFSKKIIKVCQFEFGHAQIERRLNFRDFYLFFKEINYKIGIIKPNGKINLIPNYDEFYENYYASNFVAFL